MYDRYVPDAVLDSYYRGIYYGTDRLFGDGEYDDHDDDDYDRYRDDMDDDD